MNLKPLLLLPLLVCSIFAQEWNGSTPPTQTDRDIDSLKKVNRILEDSKTGLHSLNMAVILAAISQPIANGEWNGTTWPSINDTIPTNSLKKINKILNDARSGAAPLKVIITAGGGGGGTGIVMTVTGTANQVSVTGTSDVVISLPSTLILPGTLSVPGTVSGAGFVARFASPGPIGNTSPSTGAFTTLSASSTVSGAGFVARFSSPGPIGDTVSSTGQFTNLNANDLVANTTVSGNGFIAYLASPPPIGSTVSNTGAFTTLTSNDSVINTSLSGNGVIARFSSPGPIGNTVSSTGQFTTLNANDLVVNTTVTGAGMTARFASPGPIGSTSASSGSFTTLAATSVPTGTGFTAIRTGALGITIDGGGSAITTGLKGYLYCPYACTITAGTVLADVSGSVVIEVWKDTYANYPPVIGDKISASAPLTLSSAIKSQDTTLTGWTLSVAAGDVLAFNVNSATTVTRVHATLTTLK